MSEELDHKTFDLAAVLAGADYPTLEVDVYFDERVGFELYLLRKEIKTCEDPEAKENLQTRLEDLLEKSSESKYVVTVKGLPESARKIADAKSRKKFDTEYNLLNQEVPNAQRDDYYNLLLWQESIVKITAPNGAVAEPTPEEIESLRSSVGRSVVAAISEAIRDLQEGARAGFENKAQDTSFLFGA